MKKIYSLIGALALTSGIVAQNVIKQPHVEKYTGTYFSNKTKQAKRTSSTFSITVSPLEDIVDFKQIDPATYGFYSSPVLNDSTMVLTDASGTYNPSNALGCVFDPKSNFINGGTPIVTAADPYFLDSLFIPSTYKRVAGSTATDTLYTYVTYSTITPTNTPIYVALTYAQSYVSPIDAWSGPLIAYRLQNPSPYPNGYVIRPATAAASQTVRVKTLLTASSPTFGVGVKLPSPLNIPANNVVAAYYTFVPGNTHNNGEVFYSFSGGAPATQNGFAGIVAQQTAPIGGNPANISDMFNCPDGANHGLDYSKDDRYNISPYGAASVIRHSILSNVIIEFHIYGGTVNVAELEKNGFALGQNFPNPYTKNSVVKYELAKDVNSAVFTVTDIMGRVITSEKVGTTTGAHTINLGSYAAGVYYYSLNVDGNVTTKKMIVE